MIAYLSSYKLEPRCVFPGIACLVCGPNLFPARVSLVGTDKLHAPPTTQSAAPVLSETAN